jgi:hypothetical protein
MKLASKKRGGAKYRKRYDRAKPPFQRLLERDDREVSAASKAALPALKNATKICWNNRLW